MNQSINYNWKYPAKLEPVFNFTGRYIALSGGRASGKSWFLAHYFLELLLYKKADLLCAREFQNSIAESNYKLFVNIIKKYNLPYTIQATKIISDITKSQIVFIGLSDVTADNVKSFEDFKYVWLEEAQKISKKSWETLNPTIRAKDSQIYLSMNPEVSHNLHPIMSELTTIYKDITLHIHINYTDNPFVEDEIIRMAELTKQYKPEDYERIWLGIPAKMASNTVVKNFTEDNIKAITYQPKMDLHISCDFNVGAMMWVLAHKTIDKVFYFDEIVMEDTTTEATIKEVIRRYPEHEGKIIINGDAAGNARNVASSRTNYIIMRNALREHYPNTPILLHIRPANPRVKNRIMCWNNMILTYDGKRNIIIDPKCKWLLHNMFNLKYKEGTDIIDLPTHTRLRENKEEKFLMHIFDAASYLVEYYYPLKIEDYEEKARFDNEYNVFRSEI